MKKIWIVIATIIILSFIVITLMKKDNGVEDQGSASSTLDTLRKEELVKFWNLYRKATASRISGQWEEASEIYRQALEINPVHEDAIYYLGNMYLESNLEKEAETAWLQLIEVNPQSSRAHYQLGNLYMLSENPELYDLNKAEEEFETTLSINKDFTQPLIYLGQISLFKGDLDKAHEYFTTVLGSDYYNLPSNYLIGFIRWKKGEHVKALEHFKMSWNSANPKKNTAVETKRSSEGDTRSGKSLQRHINKSIFQSYLIDLSGLEESRLKEEMAASYQKLDTFLTK